MARRRPEGIIARHSYGCPARWDVGSEKRSLPLLAALPGPGLEPEGRQADLADVSHPGGGQGLCATTRASLFSGADCWSAAAPS